MGHNPHANGIWALAMSVLSLVFMALIPLLAIYSLCGAIICSLAALAFANAQKKKENTGAARAGRIIGYVVLVVAILVFVGGAIYSGVTG